MNTKTTAAVAATAALAAGAAAASVDLSKPGDTPAAPEATKPDPFANLKVIKLAEDDTVVDMSELATSDPRKYGKVHADAVAAKLPVQRGWKHAAVVFVPSTNKGGENGFKPGSVYGTIADIVTRAGRSGITAQQLVTLVRQRQLGNKRSHYCEQLPPVGWAEGWINTAYTKNIIGVHPTKKAPALTAPVVEEAKPEAKAA